MRYETTNHGKIIIDDGKRLVLDCESCNKHSRRFELWIRDDGGILKHKGNIYDLETAAPTVEELPIEKTTETPTDVIYRVFVDGRDVIAFFPGVAATLDTSLCKSYQHIGQHVAASIYMANHSRQAKPEEYGELHKELTRIGYNLNVVKRFTKAHQLAREEQVKRPVTQPRKNKPGMIDCHVRFDVAGSIVVTWPIDPDVDLHLQSNKDIDSFVEACTGSLVMRPMVTDIEECPDEYLELAREQKRTR